MWWLILIFILLFMLVQPKVEGLVMGKYDYLAPIPNLSWGQITIQKFVDKYNEMGYNQLDSGTFTTDKKGMLFMNYALEEEGLYYIQNGRWPYNEYVTNYLKSNSIPKGLNVDNVPITKDNIDQFYPNRYVYMSFISQKESSIKPPPESYQVFKGSATVHD
jgi:hypothetical protein